VSSLRSREDRKGGYPHDLREAGRTDDPLFSRPLVYGRIDTGVVEMRRPGSDVKERHELKTTTKEAPTVARSESTKTEATTPTTEKPTAKRRGPKPGSPSRASKMTARIEELEAKIADLERRLAATEARTSVDLTKELLRIVEIAVARSTCGDTGQSRPIGVSS